MLTETKEPALNSGWRWRLFPTLIDVLGVMTWGGKWRPDLRVNQTNHRLLNTFYSWSQSIKDFYLYSRLEICVFNQTVQQNKTTFCGWRNLASLGCHLVGKLALCCLSPLAANWQSSLSFFSCHPRPPHIYSIMPVVLILLYAKKNHNTCDLPPYVPGHFSGPLHRSQIRLSKIEPVTSRTKIQQREPKITKERSQYPKIKLFQNCTGCPK